MNENDLGCILIGILGPVVDGSFVPDLPGRLLSRGDFAQDVKVMVGHNANEVCSFR